MSSDLVSPALKPGRLALQMVALQMVALYGLFAALCMLLADHLPPTPHFVSLRWLFVLATAVLMYALLHRLVAGQQRLLERERAAVLLQGRSLRLLKAVVDNSPDVIYAKDRQGLYELFNRAAERAAARAAGSVIGQHDSTLFSPEQALMICANDERVMSRDAPESFEEVVDTAVGRVSYLSIKGPLHDAQGRVVGLFGISRDGSQRQAAQADLLASNQRLRDVLARVGDGFLSLDLAGCFVYVNPRAVELLSRESESDLLGRCIWTEFPAMTGTPFQRAFEQAMASQTSVLDVSHQTPQGRWFEGRLYPFADGLSVYFTDVTDRRQAEQALRVNELRYRLAAAHGQVWDWDSLTGNVSFADAFWQLFGLHTPSNADASRSFVALLHPADGPRWRAALQAHLQQRKPYQLEFRARRDGPAGSGDWRWFQTQGQAVWDTDGRATYMAGTTFEITERKAAEAALGASEAYRSSLFEQLADAVLLTDASHHIIDANPQALALSGYGRDELLGLRTEDLMDLSQRAYPGLTHDAALAGRPALVASELVHKSGQRIAVEVNTRAVDQHRLLTVVRDVSMRHASEQTLRQLQGEVSQLAQRQLTQEKITTQRVAQGLHDHLGQTLAVARLHLDACLASHAAQMLPTLQAQGDRISQLLDQAVQEVRQVLADLRPPLLEEQGLLAALEHQIGACATGAAGPDVLLEVADAAIGQRWPADVEYAAFMVAREALINALKHAQGSLIRVVLDGDENALQLMVVDDGVGIPAPLLLGRPGHLGLVGMRERTKAIGGRFSVATHVDGDTGGDTAGDTAGGTTRGTSITLHWARP